jgi:hypothetical protein
MILPQLQEVIDIAMPGFKVNSEGSLAFTATLVDKASCVVENFEHRDQAVCVSISSSDIAIDSANIRNSETYSTSSLGYFCDLFQGLKNSIH